jgi:hypothetical protein
MSRLASFQGPSTPSKTPVNPSEQASPSPSKGKKSTKPRQQQGKNSSGTVVQSPSSSSSPARPNPSQKKAKVTGSPHAIAKDEPLNLSTHQDVSGFIETAVHKRLRQTLFEIRGAARRWEEATKVDGFKAAKEIVDARTLIEYVIPSLIHQFFIMKFIHRVYRNALAIVPKDRMPSKVVVGPHMCVINEDIRKLDGVLADLVRLLIFPAQST